MANAQAGDGLWMIYWIFLDDSGIFWLEEMYMIVHDISKPKWDGSSIFLGSQVWDISKALSFRFVFPQLGGSENGIYRPPRWLFSEGK